MYGVIYKITNTINNKCYIGQTTVGVRERYQISNKLELNYGIYLYHKKQTIEMTHIVINIYYKK